MADAAEAGLLGQVEEAVQVEEVVEAEVPGPLDVGAEDPTAS